MRFSLSVTVALLMLCATGGVCRADAKPDPEEAIAELYKKGKLFDRTQFRAVRAAFSQRFELKYAEVIRKAYGDDHAKLTTWLDAHPAIKETFYTAIDEQRDRIDRALSLFKDIWRESPENLEKHYQLAIAVAITWDDERTLHDYARHQVRTRSRMPGNLAGALDNFRYIVENERKMEGRTNLPWELLVFVVDHRTPLKERLWAHDYYKKVKGRVKSWHQDVPYDKEMLRTELASNFQSSKTRLEGHDYTLANIKDRGGVCAMQADFAARVGKSLCVPAVYCRGQSAIRGWHAWWMFVQVTKSAGQVRCNLISDGRVEGFTKDLFYTGFVVDAQTGQQMLDRDMERRMSVASRDPAGKRHAELAMRAYPWLSKRLDLDLKGKVTYLNRVLKISAYNEASWTEFARMVKKGELSTDQKQVVLAQLSTMSRTFSNYPDFVRQQLDDLAVVQPDARERTKLYEQALTMFERAQRPDLACEARLKITELLCEQERWQSAARGLMTTVRKFPTEGRYVPRMTKKLQEVSGKYKGGDTRLAQLYIDLVPAMIVFYKGDGTSYADDMYKQAVAYLDKNNLTKYATALKTKVDQARLQIKPRG